MESKTLTSIATIGAVAASGVALGAIAAESIPVLAVAGAIAVGSGLFALPKPKPSHHVQPVPDREHVHAG